MKGWKGMTDYINQIWIWMTNDPWSRSWDPNSIAKVFHKLQLGWRMVPEMELNGQLSSPLKIHGKKTSFPCNCFLESFPLHSILHLITISSRNYGWLSHGLGTWWSPTTRRMAPLTAAMQFRSGTESYMQVRSGDDLSLSTVMARNT